MTTDELIFKMLVIEYLRVDQDTGYVFSNRPGSPYCGKRIGSPNEDGYLATTLRLGKLKRKASLHRIVLTDKIGCVLPVGSIADHIDRVRTNNKASNLRLVSVQENSDNSKRLVGEDSPHCKINRETADAIRLDYVTSKSYIKTAEKFGITFAHVGMIVRNELWTDDVTTTHAQIKLRKKIATEARRKRAEDIRAYCEISGEPYRVVAEMFSISPAMVGLIVRGNAWK